MPTIHPTAIIAKGAELASGVTVAPYAVIGANVKIDTGTAIGAHAVIDGHTVIGRNNNIAAFAAVGGKPQDMKYRDEPTRLEIGDRNTIREFTTIHTGTVQDKGLTKIGDDNWIMAYVHIAHDCQIGSHTIFSNNAQIAGHVKVDDWAILGGMAGVHQFVHIGQYAMLGGASALVQDLPPFVIAAGNKAVPHGVNLEGLRRRGFDTATLSALKHAYRLLYKSGLSFEAAQQAIASFNTEQTEAAQQHVGLFLDFLQAATRGIAR